MTAIVSLFAPAGAALILGAWLHYLALIPKERVPEVPIAHHAIMVLGSLLGIAGVALHPGVASALLTAVGLSGSVFWFYLFLQAALPDGEPSFSIGDPLPAFEALDGRGETVSSETLQGKRLLLKFFRGYW